MTGVASGSLCLVDPLVLLEAARSGNLAAPPDGTRLAVAAAAHRSLGSARDGADAEVVTGVRQWTDRGEITVVSATAVEIGPLASRDYRERLSIGEIEALALVRARGLDYCTEQQVVIEIMRELNLAERLVPVATLMSGRGVSRSRRRKVRGERVRGRV